MVGMSLSSSRLSRKLEVLVPRPCMTVSTTRCRMDAIWVRVSSGQRRLTIRVGVDSNMSISNCAWMLWESAVALDARERNV